MFDLKAKLREEFSGVRIVTLKELTKKIAVISKVRVGGKRDYYDYNEVTLADINKYGIIEIDSTKKKPEPANSKAIVSQALHKDDLLVSYRGLDIQVGRIDREHKQTLVSNNSAIRIQFEYEDAYKEDLSIFVQMYLQLPYVKEYIATRPLSSANDRKILSPLFLANIPIPLFESKNDNFKDFIYNRIKALHSAEEMLQEMQRVVEELENYKDDGLAFYLSDSQLTLDVNEKYLKVLRDKNHFK